MAYQTGLSAGQRLQNTSAFRVSQLTVSQLTARDSPKQLKLTQLQKHGKAQVFGKLKTFWKQQVIFTKVVPMLAITGWNIAILQ